MRHETVPAVVEGLMAARARVERGWCQGEFRIEVPEALGGDLVCPLTALEETTWEAIRAFAAVLPGASPGPRMKVQIFNDDRATTKEMVLAAFDRAIAAELAK